MKQRDRSIRVIIAGGGTGGHVYPGVAIYNALRRACDKVEVLFVGAKAGVEGSIFAELDLPHLLLAGRGVRGASLLTKLLSPLLLFTVMLRGVGVIRRFRPDVVIGTGGYASVAVVAASIVCGKRRVLQEQNSVPGMANRMLSRFAHLVLLSYEQSRRHLASRVNCAVTGNPLRIKPPRDREAGLRFFGLQDALPTVLVFGGSRGALAINEAAAAAAKRILETRAVQFVFLTGQRHHAMVEEKLADCGPRVKVLPFLEEMHHAYSVADIALSRAGASSVFELAAFGVPTVFIPYPHAADDHQRKNVAELEETDAAIVVDNAELGGDALEAIIISLLDDHDRRKTMSQKMKDWAKPHADDLSAEKILSLAGLSSPLARRPMRAADGGRSVSPFAGPLRRSERGSTGWRRQVNVSPIAARGAAWSF